MLRSLVIVLVLVNAAFYAWTQGWLNPVVGVRPDGQREPERLRQQRAVAQLEVIRVPDRPAADGAASVTAAASRPASGATDAAGAPAPVQERAASAAAPQSPSAPAAVACIEIGPFAASQRPQIDALMRPVPVTARQIEAVAVQGLWMVYMGPYADAGMLERKQDELRRIRGLNFEPVRSPASLALGISLGRFAVQADANAALEGLRQRGIRTARVVTVRPASEQILVRIPKATPDQQRVLGNAAWPDAKTPTPCR